MAEIRRLAWDSDFFGIEIGEWTGGSTESAQDFDLIYHKSDTDTDEDLPGFKCTFSEQRIIFGKKLISGEIANEAISEFPIDCSPDELYELAYESGKYSRFKLDPGMDNNDFERLYRLWVDNSVNRQFADNVLIYQADGNIAGFVTYAIKDGVGNIGLIAVSPNYQGRGIGKKLVCAVEEALVSKGFDELQIPTQASNVSACAFYKKLGYRQVFHQYIKHLRKE